MAVSGVAGNPYSYDVAGYPQNKKAYDIMLAVSDSKASDGSSVKTKSTSEEYSEVLADYAQTVKDKIENGETETSYQIGGRSFTQKEWEKLISRIDESIDNIKEEVKAEAEQAKEKAEQEKLMAETVSNTDTASKTDSVTEAQIQKLLKDHNGRRVELYGSNAPYSYLAKDGVIEHNGVAFNCDYERNRLTLGDVSNPKNCLNIPLSKGGTLVVNVDNLGDLSKAIDMFSPEDIRRIMEAIAQYNKAQEMQQEIDEDTNSLGDSATEEIQKANSMGQSGITDPNQSPAAPLVSESIRSTDQTESSEEKGKLYITWYNEDGIFCREQGQTEGYLWSVPLNGKDEYDKVRSFLSHFGQDENLQFANDENFWKEFLAGNVKEEEMYERA